MNCTKHSPSRLVDVTDQTGVTSSQAAASAARPNARPERLVTLATTGANKDRRRAMAERLLTVQEAGEMLNTGERFPRRLIAERRIRLFEWAVMSGYPRAPSLTMSQLRRLRQFDCQVFGNGQQAWPPAFWQRTQASFGTVAGALSRSRWADSIGAKNI
jgi:hypothetical protein